VSPGSIVLLHDGSVGTNTAEALPCIIKRLRAQGYEFGKL
jgi:peptidoglycan/xylan/chitin deacetylase (PgdA/CDA1 family)